MNIAIVDDVPAETADLINAINEYSALNRLETEVSCFGSAEEFLADFSPLKYTFIVMDIYMNGQTGLEAVRKIRERDKNALIIFMSSSDEHYADALRLHAFDFLKKPPAKERIFELMDDVTEKTTDVCPSLEFVCSKETIRLPYDHIASISANGHYSEITAEDKSIYKTRMPYSAVYEILSADNRFLEINRGTTVNLDMITKIDDKGICHLTNGTDLPVNVKKCKTIINTWQNYMFAVLRNETRRRK